MKVENNGKEIVVRIPATTVSVKSVQRFLDWISIKEASLGSQATQDEVDVIAEESKKSWWEANRHKFIHDEHCS